MLLKNKYPSTKNEFIKELNLGIRFENLTIGTRKKIWWKCKKNNEHVWLASVNQRTSGKKLRGCPFCAGKKVNKDNAILSTNKLIAEEWNYELNKNLKPDNISPGSNKKVWWKCKKNNEHVWLASPKQRIKQNNSCPFCNSIVVLYPEIARELHPLKNDNVDFKKISYSSHIKLWWKCSKGFDHVWMATPNSRTSMKTGCPICSGHKVVKSNSLAVVYPKIASQWLYKKNVTIQHNKF
ncbi:MAG: hypothetical protein FJW63_10615 [Actinobacteria bacterium]|nr:hypothetical protein [Actinomycetota bacterium]